MTQILKSQATVGITNQGAFNQILEFADIPGPIGGLQLVQRARGPT